MPAVAAVLHDAGAATDALDRVVCGAGPGSFTSLRIVGSIAKGLCVAHSLSLFAVPSLALMTPKRGPMAGAGRWLAVLDAMRGDVYASLLLTSGTGQVVGVDETRLVARSEVAGLAERLDAVLLGEGQLVDAAPSAASLARVDPALVSAVSLANWEPAYGRLAEAQVKWEAAHGRALAPG